MATSLDKRNGMSQSRALGRGLRTCKLE